MIDYYNMEKIIQGYRAEAVKAAAQDRLAAQATSARLKNRRADGRTAPAKSRALALAGVRDLETAGNQGEG